MIRDARGRSPQTGRTRGAKGSTTWISLGGRGRKTCTRRRRRIFFIRTSSPSVRRTWIARVEKRGIGLVIRAGRYQASFKVKCKCHRMDRVRSRSHLRCRSRFPVARFWRVEDTQPRREAVAQRDMGEIISLCDVIHRKQLPWPALCESNHYHRLTLQAWL